MHSINQGFIAGISGGDIGQGFLSGMVSSAVGSIVHMSGSSLLGNNDVTTIFFGTVSGGLSAELTGGNFWQGAAIGLTVSGLNHVAHRIKINTRIDAQFEGTGMNPNDKVPNTPSELLGEAHKVKDTLPELKRLDEQANYPGIELGRENTINLQSKNIVIKHMENPYTYRQLAITIGHELVHFTHYTLGYMNDWKRITRSKSQLLAFSEVKAYQWELYWGGNINYGSIYSPSQWINIKLKGSGILPQNF